jgi:metallophosphoesterase superfamily enzyme
MMFAVSFFCYFPQLVVYLSKCLAHSHPSLDVHSVTGFYFAQDCFLEPHGLSGKGSSLVLKIIPFLMAGGKK